MALQKRERTAARERVRHGGRVGESREVCVLGDVTMMHEEDEFESRGAGRASRHYKGLVAWNAVHILIAVAAAAVAVSTYDWIGEHSFRALSSREKYPSVGPKFLTLSLSLSPTLASGRYKTSRHAGHRQRGPVVGVLHGRP